VRDKRLSICRLVIGMLLLAIASGSSRADASDVRFVGSVGFSGDGTSVILVADQVRNFDTAGVSGQLRLELWATATPFSGSFAGAYQLATYAFGTLPAGGSATNVNSIVPYTSPPSGLWYVAMVLTEYTGASGNGGYSVDNYLNFSNQIFGSGPPPPPPSDTTPPTVSIALPTSGNVSGTVTVSVSAGDNVGVTRVDLLVNGVSAGSDTSAPYQFSWNTANTTNGAAQLKAIAHDAAGNSAQSATVIVNVANAVTPPPDTTPPTVSIASPTGGNVSGTVTVSVNASDNVGVTRVDLLVNGVSAGSDSSAPYQFPWNSANSANGAVQLKAVAYDAAGNSAQSAIVTVNVANAVTPPPDTTPPTVSIASPTGGTVSGTVTINVNASDNVGVTRVDLLVNGQVVGTDAGAPWRFSWNSASVTDGTAHLIAVAYDAAGNSGTSAVVVVTVANAAAPPPILTTAEAIEFYNASLDHYFISASQPEIEALDAGRFVGWARTGQTINVYAEDAQIASPVCRFYLPPAYGDSHFYSASSAECSQVAARFPYFVYESADVFRVDMPDTITGACPNGETPVYRVWNNRADTNHRYTTSRAIRDQMVAFGYVAEGYGPDAVIMCAPL
jgi:hypothetical protein